MQCIEPSPSPCTKPYAWNSILPPCLPAYVLNAWSLLLMVKSTSSTEIFSQQHASFNALLINCLVSGKPSLNLAIDV